MIELEPAAAAPPDFFNPFPGLRPFEFEKYHLFFGREGQSDRLVALLERTRFLAVVGSSGSGKSSLVRAGLLPALYGGMMAGAGSAWRVALMRPGGDPLGHLACALAGKGVLGLDAEDDEERAAVIEATLRRGALGLVEAVRQARLPAGESVLVVVDQFEELFRFRGAVEGHAAGDDATAFVKLLLEAAAQCELPIYVVLTMRSDFLGDCAKFWGLPEAINQGQYLVPRMTRDERRLAITGPVAVGGGEMSHALVNRLLNDVGDNPDQLPILQHALMRSWDYWSKHQHEGEPLGLRHYEAVGGMDSALSQHADEAFDELPDEGRRRVAEKIFKALTEREGDGREVRRPTRFGRLCEVAGASAEEAAAVIEVFRREGRSFLMPPAGFDLEADTVVDVSHESLIRNWKRLRAWVNEEAQSARTYRRLAEAAVLHRESKEGLLRDPALQLALDWQEREQPNAAWAERYHSNYGAAVAFLEASKTQRDEDRARAERLRQKKLKRLRVFAISLSALSALALVAFAVAFVMAKRAEAERAKEHLNRHALMLIESYQMEQAEQELRDLYEMHGDDREGREGKAWVLYNLGYMNDKLERFDQAIAFYQSALDLQEDLHGKGSLETVGILDSLARSLREQRSYEEATMRYEQLLGILNAAPQQGRYFKLNVANVHADLAELYVERAAFEFNDANRIGLSNPRERLRMSREKAREQYRMAFAIWDDVLRQDGEALASKYVKAARFFREALDDESESSAFEKRADLLYRSAGIETRRVRLDVLNAGNDPAIATLLPPSGTGFITYGREPGGANQYGRASTVSAVQQLGAAWAKMRPGVSIAVGDVSRRGGGPFPPHADHQNGREVDVRPFTNNGINEPTNVFAPNYSHELTRELVLLIKRLFPDSTIRFNDPRLVAEGLTTRSFGHDDYLHVLFP